MIPTKASNFIHSKDSPSKNLQTLTATLLGYQFGDLENGKYRQQTSEQIIQILHEHSSGLLHTTHSEQEVSATTNAIEQLFRTDLIPQLFHWSSLSSVTAHYLCSVFSSRAAQLLIPIPQTCTVRDALHALHVTAIVIQYTKTRPPRAALHNAYFASFRLIPSMEIYSDKYHTDDKKLLETIRNNIPLPKFEKNEESNQQLNIILSSTGLPPSIEQHLKAAVEAEQSHLHPATQCDTVYTASAPQMLQQAVDTFSHAETTEGKVSACVLSNLTSLLVEHSEQNTRVCALSVLSQTYQQAKPNEMLSSIHASLLWHDPQSIRLALPMISWLIKQVCQDPNGPALASKPPREWTRTITELIRVMESCERERVYVDERSDDPAPRLPSESHICVAVDIAALISSAAGNWLIVVSDKYLTTLCRVLRSICKLLKTKRVEVNTFQMATHALVNALTWIWCRAHTFDAQLLESCLEALIETASCDDETKTEVKASLLIVIETLAKCGHPQQLKDLVDDLYNLSCQYRSLNETAQFLENAQSIILHVKETHEFVQNTKVSDPVIIKYFPNLA